MSDRNIAMSEASGAAKTNRIDQRLAKLREEGGTALIPFILLVIKRKAAF